MSEDNRGRHREESVPVHARISKAMFAQLKLIEKETGKKISELGREGYQAVIGAYLNARKK